MKAKEFIPASKPRNFVAKNQKTAGAGAHRDKKKEQKQGYEKHKGKVDEVDRRGFLKGLGAAALAGTGISAAASEGPLPVIATIKFKADDGTVKVIKKDLGHSYDYRLEDAKKDLENILEKKGIKQYSIHLDRYKDNESNKPEKKDQSQQSTAATDYIDKGPYSAKQDGKNYLDKSPYTAKKTSANYMDKSSGKEFRDIDNY